MIQAKPAFWRTPPVVVALLLVSAALTGFLFRDAIAELLDFWNRAKEYGHGFLIPFVALYLAWQKKSDIQRMPLRGSWLGPVVVLMGLAALVVGGLSTIFALMEYGLVIVLAGATLAVGGGRLLRVLWAPLVFLLFMIPLPDFLNVALSAKLQLVSSNIGVLIVRLFGISVFQEGNVIDLGTYRLQVVEACSGLRYLFPLSGLAFLVAYLFSAPAWARMLVFVSSIPITIFMNSFRIGVIGVLVEYGGPQQAEGFLHDFEGWSIFLACLALLIAEVWLLNRWLGRGRAFADAFGIDAPTPAPKDAVVQVRPVPPPVVALAVLLGAATFAIPLIKPHAAELPSRAELAGFPMQVGEWRGVTGQLEKIYLDALALDDYILVDYADKAGATVNLYVAYYNSQNKGRSAHSPRTCIPGGGWEIESLARRRVPGADLDGKPLDVNRLVIRKGSTAQLVYYWFQQRGRIVTNEYAVKWYLLADSMTRGRTDGALVRLTATPGQGESMQSVDNRLASYAAAVRPSLGAFIPD